MNWSWKWFFGSLALYMAVRAGHDWLSPPLSVSFIAMFVVGGISGMWRTLTVIRPS